MESPSNNEGVKAESAALYLGFEEHFEPHFVGRSFGSVQDDLYVGTIEENI